MEPVPGSAGSASALDAGAARAWPACYAKVICMQTHLRPAALRRPRGKALRRAAVAAAKRPAVFHYGAFVPVADAAPPVGMPFALERVTQARGLPRAANPRNLAAKAPAVPFLAKKTFFRGKVW